MTVGFVWESLDAWMAVGSSLRHMRFGAAAQLSTLPDCSVVSYLETFVPDCVCDPQIEVRPVRNGTSFDSATYDILRNSVDI